MVKADTGAAVFDRALLRRNRKRHHKKFQDHAFLYEWANGQILDRLQFIKRDFETALHLGPILPAIPKTKHVFHMDCIDADVIGDEEFLPFADHSLDLVTSNLSLHMINDLPGALVQIRRVLKPDGLFLAAMMGGETLHELRESLTKAELSLKDGISPRVFPFADKQQMGALLQRAGFALPVIDSDIVTVTYDTIFKLFADIRGMGQGNAILERGKNFSSKSLFLETAKNYQSHAEKDGRLPATFEVIFLLGWAPHASQQKPLRPGSATYRLADALGAEEIKSGLKAQS